MPFFEAETGLARKVVDVLDEAVEDVAGAWVGALAVYELGVFGYVFYCEIFEVWEGGEVVGGGWWDCVVGCVFG